MADTVKKSGLAKTILPAFVVLAAFFCLFRLIINIPENSGLPVSKVTYPDSYEFKIFDSLLQKHVKKGLIDYRAVKSDPSLQAACAELSRTSPRDLKGKLELLSFWVNTYNLLTIKYIADAYPIVQLQKEASSKNFVVGGKSYTLAQIKDEVFPDLITSSDWRAIFLTCNGTMGAPKIAAHAFTASRIGDDFEPAMKQFILNKGNYSFDKKTETFSISPFYRSNIRYIDRVYATPFDMVVANLPEGKNLTLEKTEKNYALPYDWRINDTALFEARTEGF